MPAAAEVPTLPRQARPRSPSPSRIQLDIPPDYRAGEMRQRQVSPVVASSFLVLGGFLLFHLTSWFIDYTRGEMRAMVEVVDRLALPPSSCASCEKPFRIVSLRSRPYYDPPTDRIDLLDPQQAVVSAQWVDELRQEVQEFKAWSEEQRQWRLEEEARLRELGY